MTKYDIWFYRITSIILAICAFVLSCLKFSGNANDLGYCTFSFIIIGTVIMLFTFWGRCSNEYLEEIKRRKLL